MNRRQIILACGLLLVLVASFAALVILQPKGPLAGGLAFVGVFVLLRVMSRFENMAVGSKPGASEKPRNG